MRAIVVAFVAFTLFVADTLRSRAQPPASEPDAKQKVELAARRLVVKRMMRAVHRGEHAPFPVITGELKSKKPNWNKIAQQARFVEVMAQLIDNGKKLGSYGSGSNNWHSEFARKTPPSQPKDCC